MRLDQYLAQSGLLTSRSEAKTMITEGAVYVDGRQVTKPSFDISGVEDKVSVDLSKKEYVSRGGVKLKGALTAFGISVEGRKCLDIGASSGGFTDCLLKHGALHVIAVDSGVGQLVQSIANDKRVTVKEHYNARYMKKEDFEYLPSLVVMDVSFISATYIIPSIAEVTEEGAEFVCLIKPQFEVGKSGLGKGGIVKNSKLRDEAVKKVEKYGVECGFLHVKTVESSIVGGDGNVEYLAHFKKLAKTI